MFLTHVLIINLNFVFLPKFFWNMKESLTLFGDKVVTQNLLGVLLTAENASLHDIFYYFQLVQGDMDDNKFADTYLVSNADYLVSNDKKLLALNELEFPPMRVIQLENFSEIIDNL